MAKKSKIAADRRRRETVTRHAERRAQLKSILSAVGTTPAQRQAAEAELRRQPRDASATRLRNRDTVDGRPRAYLRRFGLSRIRFRQMALNGELPGVHKASW